MNPAIRKVLKVIVFLVFLEIIFRCGGAVFTIAQATVNEVKMLDLNGVDRARSDAKIVRVLCVGDSMTGWGGYPQKLEQELNRDQDRVRYVVFNNGLPAASTQDVASLMPQILAKYRPDIVVLMVGVEDVLIDQKGDATSKKLFVTQEVFHNVFSMVMKGYQNLLMLKARPGDDVPPSGSAGNKSKNSFKMDTNYQSIQDFLAQRKIKLIAVQYPMLSIDQLKSMFTPGEGIVFVENRKNFIDAGVGENYFAFFYDHLVEEFGHLTPKGEDLLSRNIAEAILKIGFYKAAIYY